MKCSLTYLILLVIGCPGAIAQDFTPRYNTNARLEPKDKVISGAGQDWYGYDQYYKTVSDSNRPMIYMDYIGLKHLGSNWSNSLKNILLGYDEFIIPQVGLSMTDGDPGENYEDDVASGLYDANIENLCKGFEKLGRPAFLRIGYEFNGWWNSYSVDSYRAAYKRITNKIREYDLEVATVWCYSVDGNENIYVTYYPGPDYVDWMAIDVFVDTSLVSQETYDFCDFAHLMQKPVMIGESTAKYADNKASHEALFTWYFPYFELIHDRPEIKAFSYINWDWSKTTEWSAWGDARLEVNDIIAGYWDGEMDSSQYIHAGDELVFRQSLSFYNDSVSPVCDTCLVHSIPWPVHISWTPAVDNETKVVNYRVYENGQYAFSTLDTFFLDDNIKAGDYYSLEIRAMDRAGNETSVSGELLVDASDSLNKIRNPQFDNGTDYWAYSVYAGKVDVGIDTTSQLSGKNSYQLKVFTGNMYPEAIQFYQLVDIRATMTYELSFLAKADSVRTVSLEVFDRFTPYQEYIDTTIELDTVPRLYIFPAFTSSSDNSLRINFYMGSLPDSSLVFIDSVSLLERISSTVDEWKEPGELISLRPNPAGHHVTIVIKNPSYQFIDLALFDLNGTISKPVYQGMMEPGDTHFELDCQSFDPGIYVCRIIDGEKRVYYRKLVVIH
jgi:hypothetical protein